RLANRSRCICTNEMKRSFLSIKAKERSASTISSRLSKKAALFISRPGTRHGFEANNDMQLVWLISPPHFVELYRLANTPGFQTTKEEEERLKRKYGFREKPPK